MGRHYKEAIVIVACLLTLTGCKPPERIEGGEWEIVDGNTPGMTSTTTVNGGGELGGQDWGGNPTETPSSTSSTTGTSGYEPEVTTSSTTYWTPDELEPDSGSYNPDLWENTTSSQDPDKPLIPTITKEDPKNKTRAEIEAMSDEELMELYTFKTADGYSNSLGSQIYSFGGQLHRGYNGMFEDAETEYCSKYGEPDAIAKYNVHTEYYWFLNNEVITICKEGYVVTTSDSPYATPMEHWPGEPIHEDYYHVIYKDETGYRIYSKVLSDYVN